MKKRKNDDLNGKTKNKKHSNNISVEKSNKDLVDKKEDNLKIIPKNSDIDNKKDLDFVRKNAKILKGYGTS